MSKKDNKESEIIATGLSSAVGSLLGAASANAAMNRIKGMETSTDEDIVAHRTDSPDDVEVISHSLGDDNQGNAEVQPAPTHVTILDTMPAENPEPIIIVEPAPNVIEDVMYGGPVPEPNPIDPNIDPIVYVYGPPEPEINIDIDYPADFLTSE